MKKLSPKTIAYLSRTYGRHYDEAGEVAPPSEEEAATVDAAQQDAPAADAPQPTEDSSATPEEEVPQAKDSDSSEQAPQEENPEVPLESSTQPMPPSDPFTSGFQQQKEGNNAEAAAIGKEGAAESSAIQSGLDQVNKLPTFDQLRAQYKAKDQALLDSYNQKKLDPNHYLNSLSTAQKLTSGIALILGGIGSGLTHQPNLAAQMMNQAIDRDIEAQKNSQDQALNLYKLNKQEYGDDIAANVATKNQILTGLQYKVQQAAASAKGPIAQANALKANGIINQEMNKNNAILALHSTLSGNTSEAQDENSYSQALRTAQAYAPEVAKTAEEHYLPSVGVSKIALTPDNRKSALLLKDFNNQLDTALEVQKKAGKLGAYTPELRTQALESQEALKDTMNQLQNLNRLTPIEFNSFDKQIGKIGGINFGGTLEGLKTIKDTAELKKGTLYNQLGIRQFQSPSQPNTPDSKNIATGGVHQPISGKPEIVTQVHGGQTYTYHLNPQTGAYE